MISLCDSIGGGGGGGIVAAAAVLVVGEAIREKRTAVSKLAFHSDSSDKMSPST